MSKQTTIKQIELTKNGLEELKAELSDLKDNKLPVTIKRVTTAREYGDLSENAEYHDAKDEQRLLETRIDEIEGILAQAKVVSTTRSNLKIGVGSEVEVRKKGTKTSKFLQIVGEFEASPLENKISSASPLGKAIMGKKNGDVVMVNAPSGQISYEIIKIK
jgi:transcription elongation factor GreA